MDSGMWHCVWEWTKAIYRGSEPLALWVEGIALVAIFIYDRKDSRRERKEAHADRVAAIYEKMRQFLYAVTYGIRDGKFGPDHRFDSVVPLSVAPQPYGKQEFANIWEAYYLSILVNEEFGAYVKERLDEAVALQGVSGEGDFNKRLDVFYKNWTGDVMAKRMRELS